MSELSLESRVEKALKNPFLKYQKDEGSRRYALGKSCVRAQRDFGDFGLVPAVKIKHKSQWVVSENPDDLVLINSIFRDITGRPAYSDDRILEVVEHEIEHAVAAYEVGASRCVFGMNFFIKMVFDHREGRYIPKDGFRGYFMNGFMAHERGPVTNLARASIYAAPRVPSPGDLDVLTSYGYPDINELAQKIQAWNAANPDDSLYVPMSVLEPELNPEPVLVQ